MTETERAYLAGILDGEGCLGIGKRGKYITPTVQVSNTKPALLAWLQTHVGGNIYSYQPRVNRQRCYLWSLAGTKALRVVRLARPYLIIKQEQADLLLSIQRHAITKVGVPVMTSAHIEANQQIVTKVRELNKRGTA